MPRTHTHARVHTHTVIFQKCQQIQWTEVVCFTKDIQNNKYNRHFNDYRNYGKGRTSTAMEWGMLISTFGALILVVMCAILKHNKTKHSLQIRQYFCHKWNLWAPPHTHSSTVSTALTVGKFSPSSCLHSFTALSRPSPWWRSVHCHWMIMLFTVNHTLMIWYCRCMSWASTCEWLTLFPYITFWVIHLHNVQECLSIITS